MLLLTWQPNCSAVKKSTSSTVKRTSRFFTVSSNCAETPKLVASTLNRPCVSPTKWKVALSTFGRSWISPRSSRRRGARPGESPLGELVGGIGVEGGAKFACCCQARIRRQQPIPVFHVVEDELTFEQ